MYTIQGLSVGGRYAKLLLGATIFLILCLLYFQSNSDLSNLVRDYVGFSDYLVANEPHPIDKLIRTADNKFNDLLKNQATTLKDVSQKYRKRRGRQPPPGFDKWFEFAQSRNALLIEDFFDQIYHDLEPFWGANPGTIRSFSKDWPTVVTIRNGTITPRDSNGQLLLFNRWLYLWAEMLEQLPTLPDMDISVWIGDEPRTVLPFTVVEKYMQKAKATLTNHTELSPKSIRNTYPSYPALPKAIPTAEPNTAADHFFNFAGTSFWQHAASACRPNDTILHDLQKHLSNSVHPVFSDKYTAGTYNGFVSNMTIAKNPCHNPNLHTLHGGLIAPHLNGMYTDLKPLFTVAKLAGISNDILIPSPDYWQSFQHREPDDVIPWKKKKDQVIWRGTASGGMHDESNWWGFHRHRLVHMMNNTHVEILERDTASTKGTSAGASDLGIYNIRLPDPTLFNLTSQKYQNLGGWTEKTSDGAFINMYCPPERLASAGRNCGYTDQYYSFGNQIEAEQLYAYKYLPDVDGQSTSGRYKAFLQSSSVPIKASIYQEWHEDRLIPWKHFIPMSNEFQEWWPLLEYFLGYRGRRGEKSVRGHDSVGQEIGKQGHEWMKRAVRKDDMLIYLHRLVLEWARVTADNRVDLGYANDLTPKNE